MSNDTLRLRRVKGVTFAAIVIGLLILGTGTSDLWAQTAADAGAREMRHFWHVFVAYATAWVLILGWVWSIVRRLRRVEEKLD